MLMLSYTLSFTPFNHVINAELFCGFIYIMILYVKCQLLLLILVLVGKQHIQPRKTPQCGCAGGSARRRLELHLPA